MIKLLSYFFQRDKYALIARGTLSTQYQEMIR